jgi:hypothetical protein
MEESGADQNLKDTAGTPQLGPLLRFFVVGNSTPRSRRTLQHQHNSLEYFSGRLAAQILQL